MKPYMTPVRRANKILKICRDSREPLQARLNSLAEIPDIFRKIGRRGIGAILKKHLHTSLLNAMRNGECSILIRIASILDVLGCEHGGLERVGLDERELLKLYRAGVCGWVKFPGAREGILKLFQVPREDLPHTATYLNTKVRETYPDLSPSIDYVLEGIKQRGVRRENRIC